MDAIATKRTHAQRTQEKYEKKKEKQKTNLDHRLCLHFFVALIRSKDESFKDEKLKYITIIRLKWIVCVAWSKRNENTKVKEKAPK